MTLTGPLAANEGDLKSYSFSLTDPGTLDTFTLDDQTCGSGALSNDLFTPATGDGAFDCTFPDDDAGSAVSVTVSDDDGGSDTDALTVVVSNVAPTVTLTGPLAANEGQTKTYSYSFTDPGADTWTHGAACGGGTLSLDVFTPATKDGSFKCTFPDNGAYAVSITITDDDAGEDTDSIDVTVANVAPTALAGADQSANWLPGGVTRSLAPATFSDPGTDTHTCSLTWGDATPAETGVVSETVGSPTNGTCADSHTYGLPGIYTATVTVCDSDIPSDCGSDMLTITIGLNFYGFLQPLNDPAVSTNTPSSWKRGSNIPLKFQLRDANGAPIPDMLAAAIVAACPPNGARVSIQRTFGVDSAIGGDAETSSSPTADGGVCFRYDPTADQFIYNLGTKTIFYSVFPMATYKATGTVLFNGGTIASHTQANTFSLK